MASNENYLETVLLKKKTFILSNQNFSIIFQNDVSA